ncbi:hypothetical protein BC939DRAFT_468207 [Gamsiella multidivaricata]|uniref:uncharacterized protein n=1 Tax=Gamsiella multidivaricata TaxID=101098 RepID=UPI00221F99CD|nr:uncharacterized protein BC939DRAFT_468207 [Gamsiella multidivaricata]KAI7816688.1 hypothetical protein BC939DRAFT_468207 [Gamsiella multidivaricata]
MESQRRRRMRGRREDDRQRRCCCCITRTCACIAFGLLVCLAVTLYFLIPRTPAFMFESVSATGPPVVTRDRIREPFAIQLMVDSKSNYLPLRLSVIDIIVQLKLNQTKIADNNNLPSSSVIQPRTAQVISIPMNLDYKSLRIDLSSDAVLQKLFEVCTPIDPNTDTVIPGINLVISGNMHVWGLSWVWKPSFSLNVDNVPCPVNARAPASETPSASSVLPVPSATVIMASLTGNSEDPMAITAVDEHDQTLSPVAIATATAHG